MPGTVSPVQGKSSFYGPVDDAQRQALLEGYLDYLNRRDGAYDPQTGTLQLREASLEEMNASALRFAGQMKKLQDLHGYVAHGFFFSVLYRKIEQHGSG